MTDNSTDPATDAKTASFRDLGLPDALLQATDELGFSHCTEIQGLSLPVITRGQDIAAQAQTGTGKTAAFLLGSFARLLANDPGERRKDQPRMLVIAPTRELAIQIMKDAEALGKYANLKCAVAYGGIGASQRKVYGRYSTNLAMMRKYPCCLDSFSNWPHLDRLCLSTPNEQPNTSKAIYAATMCHAGRSRVMSDKTSDRKYLPTLLLANCRC